MFHQDILNHNPIPTTFVQRMKTFPSNFDNLVVKWINIEGIFELVWSMNEIPSKGFPIEEKDDQPLLFYLRMMQCDTDPCQILQEDSSEQMAGNL